MFEPVWDFIVKYFFTGGYNIVNTVTYGIVLGFIVFRLIPWLKPIIGRIDIRFVLMLLPFIVYGSSMREMIDQELGVYAGHAAYPANWLFVSPGIYFTMFFLTLGCIFAGLGFQRLFKVDYRLTVGAFGTLLLVYNMALIMPKVAYPMRLAYVLAFFGLSVAGFLGIWKLLNLRYLGFEYNWAIVLAHLFDASTTFVGVDLIGLQEKHVIPTLFIDLFHTAAVMYPLKLLVLLPAIYMIDDEMKDDEFGRRFIKFVILVLGAGPAIRNTVLLLLG
ncbi:MAG: DUF63 family protein [Candidatus Altiarchaeota archaeon]